MKKSILLLAFLCFAASCSVRMKNMRHHTSPTKTSDTLDFAKAFLLIERRGQYQKKITGGNDQGGYAYRLSDLWVYSIPYKGDSLLDAIGIQSDTLAFAIYRDGSVEAAGPGNKLDTISLNDIFTKMNRSLTSWVNKH